MRRLTRRWPAIAVLAALVLGTVVFVVARQSQPNGPVWQGDLTECRSAPMTHVHNPQRLEILAPCSALSGTVVRVDYVSAYDDLKVVIDPDDSVKPFLGVANGGLVVADVIATDQIDVTSPPVGSHVTVWGTWVRDKATKASMMLPAYRIDIVQLPSEGAILRGESVPKGGPAPQRELRLAVKAPKKVVVGGMIDVFLEARWRQGGPDQPASEIRLFAEMTTPDGVGVRWKAAMTDTRGRSVLHLVAIQVPSPYTLTVYAAPSGNAVTATVPILVTKA